MVKYLLTKQGSTSDQGISHSKPCGSFLSRTPMSEPLRTAEHLFSTARPPFSARSTGPPLTSLLNIMLGFQYFGSKQLLNKQHISGYAVKAVWICTTLCYEHNYC